MSTVGFVVGGVGLAAGLVLALTVGRSHDAPDKSPEKDKDKSAFVAPMLGPGGVGVMGAF